VAAAVADAEGGVSEVPEQAATRDARDPITHRARKEVTLSAYRRQLVETLIRRYRAPATLRGYGAELP
jgi:hypothetical protein